MTNYVFDMDGTLTPSRGRMDERFRRFFLKFIEDHKVYLVTGSDYYKTVEQVTREVAESVEKVFNCSGISIWRRGLNIRKTDWNIPMEAKVWLKKKLNKSKFELIQRLLE